MIKEAVEKIPIIGNVLELISNGSIQVKIKRPTYNLALGVISAESIELGLGKLDDETTIRKVELKDDK